MNNRDVKEIHQTKFCGLRDDETHADDHTELVVIEGRLLESDLVHGTQFADISYLRHVLGHGYVRETCISDYDPCSTYWCLSSPIGPISILKVRSEPVVPGWSDGPEQMSIHYVSTSPDARMCGHATRLYRALAEQCIESNTFLCRGQPDPHTDISGYLRRQVWLEHQFPQLRLVEHDFRNYLGEILRHAPWIAREGGERKWKEARTLIKDMMEKHPDSEDLAILRACAAISCMPQN